MGCSIIGCGKALPSFTVENDDLAKIVDTSDEWIVKRTGISERRIARTETTADLAVQAARAAMAASEHPAHEEIDPESIDLVICATITPDRTIPSQAALIKQRLGLSHAVAFDINAACTGCVYGVCIAESMLTAAHANGAGNATDRNDMRRALVIGAERMSRIVDWTDRSTCVLFGDGAGAVVLEWSDEASGIASSFLKNTDDERFSLALANNLDNETFPFEACGDARTDEERRGVEDESRFVLMDGRSVFKFATAAMAEAVEAVLERARIGIDDVSLIVPHQANVRIIANVARKMGLPLEKFQLSIQYCANTSSASALIALADAYEAGRILPGDRVIVAGFGGGLASGAFLFESL